MQDPPRQGGRPQHHSPPDAGGEDEGDEREHPPPCLRPPAGDRPHSDSGSDHSLPQSKSLEFDLPSPARPKSPWGRFDPYDDNEVTREAEKAVRFCAHGNGVRARSRFPSDGPRPRPSVRLRRHGSAALLRYRLRTCHARPSDSRLQACPVSPLLLWQDQDKEYVGFATLPNQVHRKSVKKGFDFTLMVAGTSRLLKGASDTAWNSPSLFLSGALCLKGSPAWESPPWSTVSFSPICTKIGSCSTLKVRPPRLPWLWVRDQPKQTPLFVPFAERITQTVEITKHTVDIEEKGVKLKLTIVDTPGFGDAVNNTEWCVLYPQSALEISEENPPVGCCCCRCLKG